MRKDRGRVGGKMREVVESMKERSEGEDMWRWEGKGELS